MKCLKLSVVVLLILSLLLCLAFPCLLSCASSDCSIPGTGSPSTAQNGLSQDAGEPLRVYVGNTSTMVFHRPDCNRIPLMNAANKKDFHTSRDAMLRRGYTPCGICSP